MGRQINFFLFQDDQLIFNDLLGTFKDICFLAYYNKTNSPSVIDDTLIRDHLKEGSRVYLARKQDLIHLRFTYIEKFNYWLIDDSHCPVLHYDRCIPIDNYIRSGRLYFLPKYVENLQWKNQNEDFVKWSDDIISLVKKKLHKHKYKYETYSHEYLAYVGTSAMQLLKEKRADITLPGDRMYLK